MAEQVTQIDKDTRSEVRALAGQLALQCRVMTGADNDQVDVLKAARTLFDSKAEPLTAMIIMFELGVMVGAAEGPEVPEEPTSRIVVPESNIIS